jgi:hypothetical protein
MNAEFSIRDGAIKVWAVWVVLFEPYCSRVLVYAETREGKRLSVVWDKEGLGDVAIDEMSDSESDEVFRLIQIQYFG